MSRVPLETHLVSVPPAVRASMLAARDDLRPGAAAVVARFFRMVAERASTGPRRPAQASTPRQHRNRRCMACSRP